MDLSRSAAVEGGGEGGRDETVRGEVDNESPYTLIALKQVDKKQRIGI